MGLSGAVFGGTQVLKCRDHKTGEVCALKVIRNQKRFHKQALIEIRILDHLRTQVHTHLTPVTGPTHPSCDRTCSSPCPSTRPNPNPPWFKRKVVLC